MLPRQTVESFDAFLASQGLRLEAVAIGGSALALLGVIERPTRDLDIMHPELTAEVAEAARAFAATIRGAGDELGDDWLNNGPMQLGEVLPEGWRARLQPLFRGDSVVLQTLGRPDLLKSKLFALCDRGTDLSDCLALRPVPAELQEAEPWVADQDAHPGWPAHVRATFTDLARRLGHGV